MNAFGRLGVAPWSGYAGGAWHACWLCCGVAPRPPSTKRCWPRGWGLRSWTFTELGGHPTASMRRLAVNLSASPEMPRCGFRAQRPPTKPSSQAIPLSPKPWGDPRPTTSPWRVKPFLNVFLIPGSSGREGRDEPRRLAFACFLGDRASVRMAQGGPWCAGCITLFADHGLYSSGPVQRWLTRPHLG